MAEWRCDIVSIIYEALQETQVEDESPYILLPQENMTRDDWIDVGISLVIAFLLAVMMIAHYPQFNNKSEPIAMKKNSYDKPIKAASKAVNTQQIIKPIVESAYQLNHVLNGVFVSEEEKVAMVNNRFFSIGDTIDGMKLISIELDKIKLQDNKGIIELRAVT